jgi:hypothetical protein
MLAVPGWIAELFENKLTKIFSVGGLKKDIDIIKYLPDHLENEFIISRKFGIVNICADAPQVESGLPGGLIGNARRVSEYFC